MIITTKYSYSYTLESSPTTIVVDNPLFLDRSIGDLDHEETYPDNIRVYAALDINPEAILRRLDHVLWQFKEVGEHNEMQVSSEVCALIEQMDLYDRYWSKKRNLSGHCPEIVELAQKIVSVLDSFPNIGTELFPDEEIEYLVKEYGARHGFWV